LIEARFAFLELGYNPLWVHGCAGHTSQQMEKTRMIVHLTTDLMSGSFLSVHAERFDTKLKMAGTATKVVQLVKENDVKIVVVDLQANGLVVAELIAGVNQAGTEKGESTPIVAYAQHVYEDLLEQAKQLEIGTVMTRGELSKKAGDLVAQYCA